MKPVFQTMLFALDEQVATFTFNREKDTNAFSRTMTLELTQACRLLAEDAASVEPRIGAVVLTGGVGRSFSVGGDFNDVSVLNEEQQIRNYLGEILDLYIAILNIEVPVVSAIDRFAIGQGLQVALMTDWRVGSARCQMQMPELKNGVACPLGSIILEHLLGRARMLELILDCSFIDPATSRSYALLNQVVSDDALAAAGHEAAKRLLAFPRTSFVTTKRIQNQRFVNALESVREESSRAHVDAFLKRTGKKHFDKVLGRAS